jgi:hypothetical protein
VVVTIETRAARADRASQVNATHSQTVLKRLEALVGNRGTVFTRSYRIKPEYAQEEKDGRRRQILVGYIATNTLEAVTGNIGAVGSVLDAAVDAGAQRVGSVEFFIAEPAPLRLEALEEAGRKAHAEAEAIAGSLDVELGELLEASTQPTAVPGPRPLQLRAATKVATPLVAGDIEIHADVSVVYSVK